MTFHFSGFTDDELLALRKRHVGMRDSFNYEAAYADTVDGHPQTIGAQLAIGQRAMDRSIPYIESELRRRGMGL